MPELGSDRFNSITFKVEINSLALFDSKAFLWFIRSHY